ncbi:MAG: VWA domain-containing protein, partial [Anaerolineales bacterium]
RWALRQRRGDGPRLDAKATLRASLRTEGVPFQLIRRRRRQRARFALICDVSTSMRPVVSFLLLLIYQLQAEVSRTRSFAFIDRMIDINPDFESNEPQRAIERVLTRIQPGHYNTDLGRSLADFVRQHPSAVDRRTTVVICGDGRNNYNDPRLDLVEQLRRRAHRLVWFNPEPTTMWGGGDSDMEAYSALADQVFQVSNLRQLSQAVDQILR